MKPKRSKYDTNPLDKKVGDGATDSFGSNRQGPGTEGVGGRATRDIGRAPKDDALAYSETEAPTRRIDDTSYPSVFVPAPARQSTTYQPPPLSPNIYQPPPAAPPSIYQPPPVPLTQQPKRTVTGINIPEKWANVLPYFPFYIGLIAAIIELLLVPRTETRTRFHAAQGLALQLVILAVGTMFSFISVFTDGNAGRNIFGAASTIFLIVSIVRIAQEKPHHIPPLEDVSKWLDEKFKPRK